MPDYKTHACGGIIAYTTVLALLWYSSTLHSSPPPSLLIWFLLCAMAGSLFPDIDIKSKGQLFFYRLAGCSLLILIYTENWQALSFFSCLIVLPLLVRHRGPTHQLWFIISIPFLAPCLAACYTPAYFPTALFSYFFFVGGALSHLLFDFGLKGFLRRGFFGKKASSSSSWHMHKRNR